VNPQESVSFDALGSIAVVAVSDPARLGRARGSVEEVVRAFDQACSRFRPDSELCQLNQAAGQAVQVTPLLIDAVTAALRAARLTDGDVDPTIGEALIALGYDRDFADLSSAGGRTASIKIVPVPGWRTVQVDPEAGTVRVPRGVQLDLGATAKALAADRAAVAAAGEAKCAVLVSLGGDMAISGPPHNDGWRVRVTDDHRADTLAPGQWITLRSGGLATSSTTARRWETDQGPAHHLVDPATSRSVSSVWRTVSVTAASCLDANIASTASIIRGERALPWLESLGLPSRLVGVDGCARHVAGWPSEGDDLPVPAHAADELSSRERSPA
jgi:FAD:protein FMN transferase